MRADRLAHLDLYSCFPTVVQTACEIASFDPFDPTRPATVTGGLTFGGGPGNNYVTHSIATMIERLRAHPGDEGLVTGLGWFSTKHAWGTYATTPPTHGFVHENVQDVVDAGPRTQIRGGDGEAVVETYTVVYNRAGEPERLVLAARWETGERTWAKGIDSSVLARFTEGAPFGERVTLRDGVVVA